MTGFATKILSYFMGGRDEPSEKSRKWNAPLQIPLSPGHKTVVGRVPAASCEEEYCVILHSEKLPHMLSRQHAAIFFDKDQKKWIIEDLKVC